MLDFDADAARQIVIDREAGQYLGHPTTVLLEDGRTMICVYPKGHGRGAILMKRSEDGGKTWSERLPTPENWATSLETPTIYRTLDANGKKRLIMFSGLYPIRMAVSEDDGRSWTPLNKIGDYGGIVAMGSLVALRDRPGHYMALFHDDGRFIVSGGKVTGEMTLFKNFSSDGGLTWSAPEAIYASRQRHLCEPGAVRSPDGQVIAVLLRENRRQEFSHIIFSKDEGQTWSPPRSMPASLSGDRHTAKYLKDGRLFISFRDVPPKSATSPTAGDWVAWVGTFDDLVENRPGQLRIRLKDNRKGSDCAYPGVEVLPDGTVVTTTYGHWDEGQSPYILSVRIGPDELK
ncbi:MAG: exo-alpha-sialidase [Pirellulaceae bacterium]|nr:exo-alpha-sialidase [Pirellulaceae bacterium]